MAWMFPLRFCTGIPVQPHPGGFGARRKNDVHTGVDLYTNEGEPVYAVEDGVVVAVEHFTGEWDGTPWWNNTDCVLVEGRSGVVCYGEVSSKVQISTVICAGTHMANVVRVLKEGKERPDIHGHRTSMLHLELYSHGTRKPALSLSPAVLDPTQRLQDAKGEIPTL